MDIRKHYLIATAVVLVAATTTLSNASEGWGTKIRRCGVPTLASGSQCWSAFNSYGGCVTLAGTGDPRLRCLPLGQLRGLHVRQGCR